MRRSKFSLFNSPFLSSRIIAGALQSCMLVVSSNKRSSPTPLCPPLREPPVTKSCVMCKKIAFFPKSRYADPENVSSLYNPCENGVQQMLAKAGGYIAVYRVRVSSRHNAPSKISRGVENFSDSIVSLSSLVSLSSQQTKQTSRIGVLRSTLYEEIQAWESRAKVLKDTDTPLPDIMSIVAFSGNVTSPPRYVRIGSQMIEDSGREDVTFTAQGIVSSLALIAFFDLGTSKRIFPTNENFERIRRHQIVF